MNFFYHSGPLDPSTDPSTSVTTTSPIFDNEEIISGIKMEKVSQALDANPNIELTNITANTASKQKADAAIREIAKLAGLTEDNDRPAVLTATCMLLQRGATSPRMKDEITSIFANAKITKNHVQKGCQKAGITPRQLARYLANVIFTVCNAYSIEGNQAKNFSIEHPDALRDEKIWASDFQTFNDKCPLRVKEFLRYNYQKRFGPTR